MGSIKKGGKNLKFLMGENIYMVMVDVKNRICTEEFKEQMIKASEDYKLGNFDRKTNFMAKDEITKLKKENIELRKENAALKQVVFMLIQG